MFSIPSWLLALGLLGSLYDSLGPDGLPPHGFNIRLYELLVLGTGGLVGLGAIVLGRQALIEIRASTGRMRGARLAVTGLLGIPAGLLLKLAPPLLAAVARGWGWRPSTEEGELFIGAVLVGIFLLVVWAAWALRRWTQKPPRQSQAPTA